MTRALTIAREFVAKSLGLTQFARAFTTGQDLYSVPQLSLAEAYRQSVWVQSAINQVTQPIKTVGLKFYVNDQEIQDASLDAFWSRPALNLSREEWIDATCGWFKLSGEFFWLLDDTWLTRSKNKSRFIVARPADMREIVQGGQLLGWMWTDAAGRQVPLILEQVVHIKRWNPYDHFRGLGELASAQLAAETDFAAGRYARDVFRNAGDAGAYVTSKIGMPTDGQKEQIIAALREKRAARMRGDFRPIFLAGDMEITDPKVATPDLAFVQNRVTTRHEIFIAFGVPASMADLQASFSIGSASEFYRLILNTCMPLANTVGGGIDNLLQRMGAPAGIESYFEWDDHPVLQAVRSERVDAAAKLWAMGTPLSVASDYLDMGLPIFPGSEKSYLPFSVQEVGSVPAPTTDPALAEPEAGDSAVELMLKTLRCDHAIPLLTCSKAPERDPARVKLWEKHMASRRNTMKAFDSAFGRSLNDARRETLAKLEASIGKKSVAADLTFSLPEWKQGFMATMRKVGLTALTNAVTEFLIEVAQADDAWSMPPFEALSFLAERENLMADIADDVHAQIEGTIQQGLIDGSGIKEIAGNVREKFNSISKERATTIAQTETAAAYGYSRDKAMKAVGIQFKQWLTSGNENVRATHLAVEKLTVPIDQAFRVGGADLMFPGDPSGPPQEVINCHCIQIAVEKP